MNGISLRAFSTGARSLPAFGFEFEMNEVGRIAMKAIFSGRNSLFAGAAFICTGSIVSPAIAVTLPPGYGYIAAQNVDAGTDGTATTHQSSTAFGSVGTSAVSPAGAIGPGTSSVSGAIGGTPSPSISGTASVSFGGLPSDSNTNPGNFGSGAAYSGSLTYYFEIFGPTQSVLVNANAVASYSATALPSAGYGSVLINFAVTQLDTLGDRISPRIISDSASVQLGSFFAPTVAKSGGFTENGTYNLLTGTIYEVDLQNVFNLHIVNAAYDDPSATGGSATLSVSLDPTFQVGAGVANPNGYKFVFSDGIGNDASVSPSVPEPSTWAMMILGFCGFGCMAYRRRSRPAMMAA